jgi:hypothetical protein
MAFFCPKNGVHLTLYRRQRHLGLEPRRVALPFPRHVYPFLAQPTVADSTVQFLGSTSYQDFMKVVAYAKTLPAGGYDSADLPPELRLKNLLMVYVGSRRAYALEFPSVPIDSNPIYIFVDQETPDRESVARALCTDHGWKFEMKLDEQGWFYACGR